MTIKGENITLTKKELTDLLQSAAEIALKKAGVTISETLEPEKSEQTAKNIQLGQFNKEEYADAMHTMEVNRSKKHIKTNHEEEFSSLHQQADIQ